VKATNGLKVARNDLKSAQSTVKALPNRLCIGIGGHFGLCCEVTLKKGRLTYTYLSSRDSCSEELGPLLGLGPQPHREEIQPSAKQWQNFRRTLDRLNVWCWQEEYPNPPGVCDGTNWSVEIAYTDKAIVSGILERFLFVE
jgi:hypothetical protein